MRKSSSETTVNHSSSIEKVHDLRAQQKKQMTLSYTTRGIYDQDYSEDGIPWNRYIEWSKPDFDNSDDWIIST